MKRKISEIMDDFLDNISKDNKRIVIDEKAKAAVKEMVDEYQWRDEKTVNYKAIILKQAQEHGIDAVTACVNDMLRKIINAPTSIHSVSVPRLIMPVLWEFIQEERKDE